MICITNHRPRLLGLVEGTVLNPGDNKVEALAFETIRKDDTFKQWVKMGHLSFRVIANEKTSEDTDIDTENTAEEYVVTTKDSKPNEAKAMIRTMDDVDTLTTWFKEEKRAGIKRDIEKRITQLKFSSAMPEDIIVED